MSISISLPKSEQDKFRLWVKQQTTDNANKCKRVVYKNTIDLHRRAMRSAPVDYGYLRSHIYMTFSNDGLGSMVYTAVRYAPYQEFGTGKYAKYGILPGYEAYARQFKGQGKRKVNIYPRMYFFPHFERTKKEFIKDLNKMGFK